MVVQRRAQFMKSTRRRNMICLLGFGAMVVTAVTTAVGQAPQAGRGAPLPPPIDLPPNNAMVNPYRMLEKWPNLEGIMSGAAIGIVPDGKGGTWLQHRSNPAILHFDASGKIIKRFDVTFSSSHGLCLDRDGNFWAVDSGPFGNTPDAGVKGNQVFKYSPDGKLLLTIGKAGVSQIGNDTFIQPTACTSTPDGNILIADGHWPRPTGGPQG